MSELPWFYHHHRYVRKMSPILVRNSRCAGDKQHEGYSNESKSSFHNASRVTGDRDTNAAMHTLSESDSIDCDGATPMIAIDGA